MTEKKTNVTVNHREGKLNLKRMTPEYFRPDIISGDISQMKIPTVDELAILGEANVQKIRSDMRYEEGKLQKLQKTLRREIGSLQDIPKPFNNSYCDWHGAGYARLPEELTNELMENGSAETYCDISHAREQKVNSCRFGRYVAEWCKQTPVPCQCNFQCYKHAMEDATIITGTISTNGVATAAPRRSPEKILPRCEHYAECFGVQPFIQKRCVLSDADEKTWVEVRSFLQMKLDDCIARIDLSKKYIRNLTIADKRIFKERNDNDKKKCPSFDLRPTRTLIGVQSGDAIVEFSKTDTGSIQVGYHLFIRSDTDPVSGEEKFIFQTYDNTYRELGACYVGGREQTDEIYMNYEDYISLVSCPEVRKVWLQNVSLFGSPFTVAELEQTLDKFASTLCPIKKMITAHSSADSND